MIKYGVDESLIKEAESKTEEELKKEEEEAKKRRLPKTTVPKPKQPPFFNQQ